MKILLLCEPRSGSTNLANWFICNKDFTVLQEPLNKNGLDYKKGISPREWEYTTDHFLIKEIYVPNANLVDLINLADKIILLYREKVEEQIESWLVASQTNQWSSEWASGRIVITREDDKINYFRSLKSGFKNDYLDNQDFFSISYEELYNGNGIEKVIDYLNIDTLENKNFPYGKKYKLEPIKPTRLI